VAKRSKSSCYDVTLGHRSFYREVYHPKTPTMVKVMGSAYYRPVCREFKTDLDGHVYWQPLGS